MKPGLAEIASPFLERKLPKFADFFVQSSRVLEIGPGTGAFLKLLKERSIQAEGVEPEAGIAKSLSAQGLRIHKADGLGFWRRAPKGRYDGLFMSNVIEHMAVSEAADLLRLAFAKMPKGAKLAISTANPESLAVITAGFWNDPQHTRPYTLYTLQEMLQGLGWRILKARPDEQSRSQNPLLWFVRMFRSVLVGPYFQAPEIFVLAEKP